jgi:hypothetical protein
LPSTLLREVDIYIVSKIIAMLFFELLKHPFLVLLLLLSFGFFSSLLLFALFFFDPVEGLLFLFFLYFISF